MSEKGAISNFHAYISLIIIAIISISLRFRELTFNSLWVDEITRLRRATTDSNTWEIAMLQDPALYGMSNWLYFHVFSIFGDSDLVVRSIPD